MSGEAQYLADTLLIERVAKLELLLSDDVLTKEAGITDMLGGVANSVKNFALSRVDTSSTGSTIRGVTDLLAPAVFFRINPILGILYTIASEMFGLNLTGVLGKISSTVQKYLMAGKPVPPEAINQAGAAALGATASLEVLHELEKKGELTKAAVWPFSGRGYGRSQPLGGSFMTPPKGTSIWHRIFGFLAQRRPRTATGLLVGFVVWFAKTALLSLGLLAGGSAVASMFEGGEDKPSVTAPMPAPPGQVQGPGFGTTPPAPAAPGTPAPQQPGQSMGYPMQGNIQNTLMQWALQRYPQLRGKEDLVANDPTFRRTVNFLQMDHGPGAQLLILPPNTTPQSIVDLFARNVMRQA